MNTEKLDPLHQLMIELKKDYEVDEADEADEVDEAELSFPLELQELKSIARLLLTSENIACAITVSVTLVSDEKMRELNRIWRAQDRATDVLSFQMDDPYEYTEAFFAVSKTQKDQAEPISSKESSVELDLDQMRCELGDIVLAPHYIKEQSLRFKTSFADECRLLFVHGLYHLLGYDHIEELEAQEMQSREDALLKKIQTDNTLTEVILTRHREEEL